jgi:hypothetical protein
VSLVFQDYDEWGFQLSFIILDFYGLGETFSQIKFVPAIAVKRIGWPLLVTSKVKLELSF